MKLAIMQPYFFPYIGYFQLINAVDQFILLEEVQYIRHGWINRNRILKPGIGIQYIIVPLSKHHQKSTIKEIQIIETDEWKIKIIRQLEHYKKNAPYFKPVLEMLEESFEHEALHISNLNAYLLEKVCSYLSIKTKIILSSTLHFNYNMVDQKDEWALTISEQLNAEEYINPIGGINLFNKEKFIDKNINISFLKNDEIVYNQLKDKFEPNLSILDVMLFNDPEAIRNMLNDYTLL